MPLPNLNARCTAICKARAEQCLNPAAFGCRTCRMHGARKPETIRRGKDHGRYTYGYRTQEAQEAYRQASMRLHEIEVAAFAAGLMTGRRMGGRKPKS
jgi:hypothetical protein